MSWLSIITYNSIYMNMYDLILFFEVDFNCAYAEFDVFCVYVKYKWNNFYKCIFGKNYFLKFFFYFQRQVNTAVKDKSSTATFSLPEDPVMLDLRKNQDEVYMLILILCLYNTIVWEKFHNWSSLVIRFGFETLWKLSKRNVLCLIWFAKK